MGKANNGSKTPNPVSSTRLNDLDYDKAVSERLNRSNSHNNELSFNLDPSMHNTNKNKPDSWLYFKRAFLYILVITCCIKFSEYSKVKPFLTF